MGRLGVKGPAGFCGHLTILGQLGQFCVNFFQAKTLAEDAKCCRASAEIGEPAALKFFLFSRLRREILQIIPNFQKTICLPSFFDRLT